MTEAARLSQRAFQSTGAGSIPARTGVWSNYKSLPMGESLCGTYRAWEMVREHLERRPRREFMREDKSLQGQLDPFMSALLHWVRGLMGERRPKYCRITEKCKWAANY